MVGNRLHSVLQTLKCLYFKYCHKISLSTSFISYLGRMIFSLGSSDAKSLKVLNLTEGGWRKGLAPKLNSHCWYDIKLAAAKKPDLTEMKERNVIRLEEQKK